MRRPVRVRWDHKRKAFELRGRLVSGLLPRLRSLLYPNYNWETVRRTPKRTRQTVNYESTYRAQFHGKENGSKLDRQLHSAVQFAYDFKLPPSVFFDSTARRLAQRDRLPKRSAHKLELMTQKLSQPALNFFRMCHMKRLTPQFSQVTVGDTEAKIGTRADIKCVNELGEAVLIENKIGYGDATYDVGTGSMKPPYQAYSNCAQNQHQVQLALTELLYNRQFHGHKKVTASYVWRFDESGVTSFPLQQWARLGASVVLSKIEQSSK